MRGEDDGNQNNSPSWNARKVLIIAGSVAGGVVLSLLLGLVIVRINETATLIDSVLTGQKETPRLLTAFSLTAHGEDGTYMRGYRVKLIDINRNSAIDEQFIAREKDGIPPLPLIAHCNDENIWIVQKPEFIQGDTGFVARVAVSNGRLAIHKSPLPTGYTLVEARGACQLKLKNKYNENYCLATETAKLSEGECPPYASDVEPYDKIKTAFILVNKTPGSTRYHLYYYATDKPDPMKISVGSGGRQSLLYKLWFTSNRLSQAELDSYRGTLGPKEKLIPVVTDEYLISPATLFKSPDLAVYAEYSEDGRQKLMCFSSSAKMLWMIDDPKFMLKDKERAIKVKMRDDLVLLSSNKWVIAVDKASRQIRWSYFF